MSFTEFNFNSNIAKAINASGYSTPTPIQIHSIPNILEGKDIVACAQTGTGKTAAFILPTLQHLSSEKSITKPRMLILAPTRELARQILDAIRKYGKFLDLKTISLVGGMPYRQQLKGLSQTCDIVVATPGRLLDHIENKKINLSFIKILILDEADRMLDMGFIDEIKKIAKLTPATKQTLLFSATIEEKLSRIIDSLLKNPVHINVTPETLTPGAIKQDLYIADNVDHKMRLLKHFLKETSIYKAIIFSATKINADKLAKQLRHEGFSVAAFHGDLKQAVRNRTLDQFRQGAIQYLVATDIAARGIDVSDITHVINYDLPKFCEDYVHRIGRTGRAGKSGIAISFALPIETRSIKKIERYMGSQMEMSTITGLEPKKSLIQIQSPSRKNKSSKHKPSKNKPFKDKYSQSKSYKDRPFKDKSSQSKSYRDKPFKDESSQNKSYRDKPFKDESSQSKSYRDKPFKDESSQSKSYRDKPFKDESSQSKSYRDKPFKDKSSQSKSYRDKPFKDESSQNKSYKDKPFKDKSSQSKSFRDKPFKDESSQSKSYKDKPFKDKPFKDKSSQSKSFRDNPQKSKPFKNNSPRKKSQHRSYS